MPHIEVCDVSLDLRHARRPGPARSRTRASTSSTSEFLCIVGPSGCGKSTLLNIIAGFLTPTAARSASAARPSPAMGIDRGVVFQDFAQLFPWRTALGNVAFGLEMKGVGRAEREEIALQQLALVKLEKFAQSPIRTISPAACSSGSPSRARSPTIPRCC